MLYREAISQATVQAMRDDPKVVLMGQMVTDFKGVFGTTLAAAQEFPDRVIECPISETMLTGACVGMAMEGYRPILVHARADWSLFSFEHLINTAAKLPWLHGKPMPWIMRVIVGRGWGQGPVHSQSFHHMLAQVPGLRVVIPTTAGNYLHMFNQAFKQWCPTVIFEPRRLYLTSITVANFVWGNIDVLLRPIGDTVLDAIEAKTKLETLGIDVGIAPWEYTNEHLTLGLDIPTVVVDMSPQRPFQPGSVAPPFVPQGASQVFEQRWYPTSDDIVAEACRMLGVQPPETKEGHEQFAPVGSPF